MSDCQLLENLPTGCKLRYKSYVYNTPSFLKANNDFPQRHFYWVNRESNVALAHVAFALEEGVAMSPFRSPFGGIEVSDDLDENGLLTFLTTVESALFGKSIRHIRLDQAPDSYRDNRSINKTLTKLGYKIKEARKFHGIVIGDISDHEMTRMEKRKLLKCEKAGATFVQISNRKLSGTFKLINEWRTRGKIPLSMTWEELKDTRKRNPGIYIPFGVMLEGQLIAATVAVKVNEEILYHFFPASDEAYNNYSPMVMLVDGLLKWCQKNDFKLLDLGTSYVNKKEKASLVRFKENIGGRPSEANSWRKTLS